MRTPPARRPPRPAAALLAAALLVTGCSAVDDAGDAVDKVRTCHEATKVLTDTARKVTGLTDDPAQMEKTLKDAAAKLEDAAKKAGDVTLRQALSSAADAYRDFTVDDAESAIDTAAKVGKDTADVLVKLSKECT